MCLRREEARAAHAFGGLIEHVHYALCKSHGFAAGLREGTRLAMGLRRAATPLLLSLLLAAAHARREHDGNRKRGHGASGSAAALMGLPAEAGRFRDARFAQQESRGVFDFLKNMFGGSSQSTAPTATTGVSSLGALGRSSAPTSAPPTMPQPSASLMGMIDRAVKANDWKPPSIRPTRRPFEALLPALERYRDSQYTLSGGVFVSMDQGEPGAARPGPALRGRAAVLRSMRRPGRRHARRLLTSPLPAPTQSNAT